MKASDGSHDTADSGTPGLGDFPEPGDLAGAENLLATLASVFFPVGEVVRPTGASESTDDPRLEVRDRYRILVEQIPAVVFMAYLDGGVSEAYVSPQIETLLGFTQEEWLNDPVRWYRHVHPEDKGRWSVEAAEMFLTGKPLRSVYRVLARDGRIVWFHCEARMVRDASGRPWFIHGVAFDVTDVKTAEAALHRREEELRKLTASLLSAQDEERRRIARDLHDGAAQNLAGLAMNLSILMSSTESRRDPNTERILSESLDLAEQCSREIRNLSYLLHPPLLDDLGLASALKSYIAGFIRRTGIDVSLEMPRDFGRLAPEVETALFRIVQEGLANVHRHSGAQQASIQISVGDSEVNLVVHDEGLGTETGNGESFDAGGVIPGVGIPGMRERAQQLGGRMRLESNESGTTVTVALPKRGTA